jgi:hypothetical protein
MGILGNMGTYAVIGRPSNLVPVSLLLLIIFHIIMLSWIKTSKKNDTITMPQYHILCLCIWTCFCVCYLYNLYTYIRCYTCITCLMILSIITKLYFCWSPLYIFPNFIIKVKPVKMYQSVLLKMKNVVSISMLKRQNCLQIFILTSLQVSPPYSFQCKCKYCVLNKK